MTKSIFNTWKNFREISVFRASGISSKILKNNKYCSAVKNFRPNSVNQGKRRSSNITKVETDGQGLYLKLFSGKGLSRVGSGLYLKQRGQVYSGEGLLLGPNSLLKNIPAVGWFL